MRRSLISFLVGILFALGLGFGGMTQPQKIISFLNLSAWDPSLIFVMVGAIGVHAILYPLIRKRKSPLFEAQFHVPERNDLTPSLIIGSAIFGIGWGLAGYCPGPAIVSLVSGQSAVILFVGMMLLGMAMYRLVERHFSSSK